MVRNGKQCKTLGFWVAATFEKPNTYVFAGRLIRNGEVTDESTTAGASERK